MARDKLLILEVAIVTAIIGITGAFIISDASPLSASEGGGSGGNRTAEDGSGTCDGSCAEGGEGVQLDEGNSGTIHIPFVGSSLMDTDEKHHWDMPTGKSRVTATLTWSDTSWDLEFSIGVGECPHQGTAKAVDSGTSGSITVQFQQDPLDEGQWFAHVRCLNPDSHRGESCDFTMEVLLAGCSGEHPH